MIRRLRGLHRGAFVLLAAGLPVLVVAALRARREEPRQELPAELRPGPAGGLSAGEDWLVYWVAAELAAGATLPEGAELAGSLRTGALEREPPPGKRALLYSLLGGRVVSAAERAERGLGQ